MREFFEASGLNIVHFALAYAGMLIHVLLKLQELNNKGISFSAYLKKNIFSLIASVISIPVLLLLSADTALKEWFPINYGTSVLAGWQTQSIFKTLMEIASKRTKKEPTND